MNLNEFFYFVESYISEINRPNDNRKIRIFAKYIEKYSQEYERDIVDIFQNSDDDFFLNNILEYITELNPTKNVATEYRRIIINFSKEFCKKCRISNVFLNSVDKQTAFNIASSDLFRELRESEHTECMSSEELELLNEKIDEFFSMENFDENILMCIEDTNHTPNHYGRLISAIAVKLIECFGVSNDVIAQLELSALSIEHRQLTVNGFDLFLNEELLERFRLYLKYRQLVVQRNESNVDKLFITNKGKAYLINEHANNSSLFIILNDVFSSFNTKRLQYKAITDLVSIGANILLLYQLTGTDVRKIAELSVGRKTDLEDMFRSTKHPMIRRVPKGRFICPGCEKMIEASAEKAVLLRFPNDRTLYLYCKECGEKAWLGGIHNE